MNAYGYCRFSPRPGADDCQSNEHQRARIEEFCQQQGFTLIDVIEEPDTSGGFDENDPRPEAFYEARPELYKLICRLKCDDVLVCRWRDRIARSVHCQGIVRMELARKGCRLLATDEANDETPEGVFHQQVIASVTELERWRIKIKTRAAMRKHQIDGRRMTRVDRIPFGWRLDPANKKRIVEDEKEQETIRVIAEAAAEGLSTKDLCQYLDGVGLLRRGKSWKNGRKVLERILRCLKSEINIERILE